MAHSEAEWPNGDAVERDLRAAIARAGVEGQWAALAILDGQLRAHLEARGGVVRLDSRRDKRR